MTEDDGRRAPPPRCRRRAQGRALWLRPTAPSGPSGPPDPVPRAGRRGERIGWSPAGYRARVGRIGGHGGSDTVPTPDDTGRCPIFGTHDYGRRGPYRVTVRVPDRTGGRTVTGTVGAA